MKRALEMLQGVCVLLLLVVVMIGCKAISFVLGEA